MNQIPKRDRYAEEVARIREIVGRHPLPDFVTGFDVRLGELDGDPAMWVVFKLHNMVVPEDVALAKRSRVQLALRQAVTRDLLDIVDDRYPYIHFESEQAAGH
jgi:hypothetical protein